MAGTRRPGRPKGVQEDPEIRRERLLVATEEAIRRYGPAVSMDQVAQQAGVSRSTLYDNFENRTALAAAVIHRYGQPLLKDLLDGLGAAQTPEAVVRTGLRIYLDHIEASPEVYRFVVRNTADDTLFLGVAGVLGSLVAAALPADGPATEIAEEFGFAALGAIVSATERWSDRRTPPRAVFEPALGDFVWGGLVAGGIVPGEAPIDLVASFAHLR